MRNSKMLQAECGVSELYLELFDYLCKRMATKVLNTIEYLVLIVSQFARKSEISELEAYNYLEQYGAIALCEKHYGIMHTLSVEENIESLTDYCRRKGGAL